MIKIIPKILLSVGLIFLIGCGSDKEVLEAKISSLENKVSRLEKILSKVSQIDEHRVNHRSGTVIKVPNQYIFPSNVRTADGQDLDNILAQLNTKHERAAYDNLLENEISPNSLTDEDLATGAIFHKDQ